MRRDAARALVGLSVILLAQTSLAQSTVELGNTISFGEGDKGIEGISISNNQKLILAHGANTGIFLIDSNAPENNSHICLLYTSPSPRDGLLSRMPSSA